MKKIANTTSIFHIKLKSARAYTQQFKLKLLKLIVYILQIWKSSGAYSCLNEIFVNIFDVEARCAFFTYAGFQMKITSTSQTTLSGSQHFLGRIGNPLFFCNKSFDQKLPDALALAGFPMFCATIFYTSHLTNSWCLSCNW